MQDWSPGTSAHESRDGGAASGSVPSPAAAPWKPLEIPPDPSRHGLYVGTSGFNYDDWAGAFYPPRGARVGGSGVAGGGREWFPFYQLYFSFLEVNHTFLREADAAHFAELERRSRPNLRIAVMAHRDVSQKGTWDAQEGRALMKRHAAAVAPLADSGRFYSFLVQLDHRQERSRRVLDCLLAACSAAVEERLDVHLEFRNRTWHQEPVLRELRDAGIGICNPDLPDLPLSFPLRSYATTSKGYLRYSGRNAAAWGPETPPAPRRPGGGESRYDYLYAPGEIEARVPGQLLLLRKAGEAAVVFKNHVRGQAAVNAVQNLFLAERLLRRGRG